jgi:hypothetical protein
MFYLHSFSKCADEEDPPLSLSRAALPPSYQSSSIYARLQEIDAAPISPLVYRLAPYLTLSLGDKIWMLHSGKRKVYTVKRFTKIKDYPIELNNFECPHSSTLIRKIPPKDGRIERSEWDKFKWDTIRKLAAYSLCKKS